MPPASMVTRLITRHSNDAGAVYVFHAQRRVAWTQQAYVKASNTDANDGFGTSVSLNGDGNTLAVGSPA